MTPVVLGFNPYVFGAFVVVGFGATGRTQWQALYYLLFSYTCTDLSGFLVGTMFYVAHVLYATFVQSSRDK
jgi:hypothetical protein